MAWYNSQMHQPKNDPFFEELKADIQEALDEVRRGETVDEEQAFASAHAAIDRVARERAAEVHSSDA